MDEREKKKRDKHCLFNLKEKKTRAKILFLERAQR